MKGIGRVLFVALFGAIFCSIVNSWIFVGSGAFVPYVFLVGIFMVFVQKETVTYRFLNKLFIGSLLFSFLTTAFIIILMYVTAGLHGFHLSSSFWHELDWIYMFLILSFVVFMCGLVGVVLKGFYVLYRNRSEKVKLDKEKK